MKKITLEKKMMHIVIDPKKLTCDTRQLSHSDHLP